MSQAGIAAPNSVKSSVFGTHHNRGRTAFGDTLSRARLAGSPAAASALIDPLGSYRRHKTRLQAAQGLIVSCWPEQGIRRWTERRMLNMWWIVLIVFAVILLVGIIIVGGRRARERQLENKRQEAGEPPRSGGGEGAPGRGGG